MTSHTYAGVTQQGLDQLRRDVQAKGLALPEGNTGKAEAHGVHVSFQYTPATQMLIVTVEKVPFYIHESQVWSALDPVILPLTSDKSVHL